MSFPILLRPLLLALAVLGCAPAADSPEADSRLDSLKQWLPRSAPKLIAHSPVVRVAVLGDDVINFNSLNPDNNHDLRQAWPWQFLEQLAGYFAYTGGVRLAEGSHAAKDLAKVRSANDLLEGPASSEAIHVNGDGPIIEIDHFARNGVSSLQSLEDLHTEAFDRDPDLLIWMYGTNDLAQGVTLTTYRTVLEEVVRVCKERGVDLLIAGPPLLTGGDAMHSLGLSRPLASVAREVATARGCGFVDAGAAVARTPLLPALDDASVTIDVNEALRTLRDRYRHILPAGTLPLKGQLAILPNRHGQEIIADAAWEALCGTEREESVKVTASFTLPVDGGAEARLHLKFHSSAPHAAKTPASLAVLGLGGTWMPRQNVSATELAAGLSNGSASTEHLSKWELTIPCLPTPANLGGRLWGEEAIVRGSLLVGEGSSIRMIDFSAPILPLTISFPIGRQENLGTELSLTLAVTNSFPEVFAGTAEVAWRGQTQSFPVSIPPGPPYPLKLSLPLPSAAAAVPFKSRLVLRMKNPTASMEFTREIELSPDLLLDHPVTLSNRAKAVPDAASESKPDDTTVGLVCKAEENGLYLVIDLPPLDTRPGENQPTAIVDVTLDARSAKLRGTPGSCPIMTLEIPAQDGRVTLKRLPTGLFGNGYDRELNPQYFLASVKTQANNRRQVRLSVPRTYFYLHEWSMKETGQSTLGFNLQVALLTITKEGEPGTYPPHRTFSFVSPQMSRTDALSLGVLQFAKKPPTWSARIY